MDYSIIENSPHQKQNGDMLFLEIFFANFPLKIWQNVQICNILTRNFGQIPPFMNKPQFQATARRNEKHAKNALLQIRPNLPPPSFKQAHCFLF